jgi:2-dehydro-3-deoxyphosphogluconate aldolase/(4S)-4-hydroxy-2-oxoglutarate aldolase
MPTGGVSTDESNLRGWFDAGVTCVGMGSQLISKDILANKSYDELSKNVKDTLALIQTLKG